MRRRAHPPSSQRFDFHHCDALPRLLHSDRACWPSAVNHHHWESMAGLPRDAQFPSIQKSDSLPSVLHCCQRILPSGLQYHHFGLNLGLRS